MSRYLWAVGEQAAALQPGDTLADRYLCKGSRIFLDTKPALLPGNLEEVPELFLPYLKLSPNQLHIPQVYDWVQSSAAATPVLLLDQAPLYVPKVLAARGIVLPSTASEVQILPTLTEMWSAAPPLRQLYWLWQIAMLWDTMQTEGVASSLMNTDLLRVEGPIVRLLELQVDRADAISLSALGEFWSTLVQTVRPEVQASLQQLCQGMQRGSIRNAEAVIKHLDDSIADLGRSQQSCQIQIATLSDQGPSRQRNEDSCYPASGTVMPLPPDAPLVIVCDGIGGHQGGDVASNLAIKSLEQQLKTLQPDRLDAVTLEVELEKAVGMANDLISQQNDSEQRFDRQRMGTTVVMGLIRTPELYITHVGDSRAYWITRWGCHQITQDDDVASREVRLGYSSYPQALQQPSSGSLIQALGMGSAANLYPTVQRFILEEDCVFLLCSDGLSDNDQVENHWEKVILPLLDGRTDLGTVSRQWVDIANHYNGYDNTTVGLIHCKIGGAIDAPQTVRSTVTSVDLPPTRPPQETALLVPNANVLGRGSPSSDSASDSALSDAPTVIPTQQIDRSKHKQERSFPLLAAVVTLTAIAGALLLGVKWFSSLRPGIAEAPSDSASPDPSRSVPSASGQTPVKDDASFSADRLQATQEIAVASAPQRYDQGLLDRRILAGSIVASLPEQRDGETWVQLQVCAADAAEAQAPDGFSDELAVPPSSVPVPESTSPGGFPNIEKNPTTAAAPKTLIPGETGWISRDQYQNARSSGWLEKLDDSTPPAFSTPDSSESLATGCTDSTDIGSTDATDADLVPVTPVAPNSPPVLPSPLPPEQLP